MKIKLIDYGIASRIGNIIYINKNLTNYPKLYNAILEHEKKHSSGFNMEDFYMDFLGEDLKVVKSEYWKFVFKYPKAWFQFLPICKYDKKIVYDPIMIVYWIVLIIVIGIITWMGITI